jgi:chromosome segregation ATPase
MAVPKATSFQEENEELRARINDLHSTVVAQEGELGRLQQSLDALRSDVPDLKSIKSEVVALRDQLKQAQDQQLRLEIEVAKSPSPSDNASPSDAINPRLLELQAQMKKQSADLTERRRLVQTFHSHIHEATRRGRRLNGKRAALQTQLDQLNAEYRALLAKNTDLRALEAKRQERVRKLSAASDAEIAKLNEELGIVEAGKAEAGARRATLESEIAELKRQVARLSFIVAEIESKPKDKIPDYKLLGIDLERRAEKRAATRQHVMQLHREMVQARNDIAAADDKKADVRLQLAEEERRLRTSTDGGDASLFEKLQFEMGRLDEEVEHREARIAYLRKQIGGCGMREESIDGRAEDIVEEEDETEFTAYEIMDRLTNMRQERKGLALELTRLAQEKTDLEAEFTKQTKQIADIDTWLKSAVSKRLLARQ